MRILHSLFILIVFIFHTFYVFADLNEGYAFRSLDMAYLKIRFTPFFRINRVLCGLERRMD